MKINNICSISFNAKIIDSHCHIGQWNENNNLKDYTKDMDIFIKNTLDNGDVVEKVIISNLDCMTKNNNGKFILNEIDGNKMLADYRAKLIENANLGVGRDLIASQALGISEIFNV